MGALSLIAIAPRNSYRQIPDEASLEKVIDELTSRPFFASEEGVTISLAGAQDKLTVALLGGELVIPLAGTASTHILNPHIPRLPGSVQNEALCMVLALKADMRLIMSPPASQERGTGQALSN